MSVIKTAVFARNNTKSFQFKRQIKRSNNFKKTSLWEWKTILGKCLLNCCLLLYRQLSYDYSPTPTTASQMNEMKLNKFMIFVRYVCLQFRAFRSSQTKRKPLNRNKHFAISIALFIHVMQFSVYMEKVSLLCCVLAKAIHLLLCVRFSIVGWRRVCSEVFKEWGWKI